MSWNLHPGDTVHNPDPDPDPNTDSKSYALSGKIMLVAIVILLFVVILMVVLHLYARWYLIRARRRHRHRLRRSRRTSPNIVFRSPSDPAGLDPAVLEALPVFVFKPETHPDKIDCAVCLSEFEENESGRVLPNCKHAFHIECIDMWFHSHSTCPLCRAPVELPKNPTRLVVEVLDASSSSSSGSQEGHVAGSSGSKKPGGFVGITVEVPLRGANSGFDSESGTAESTPSQFRSPVGRMLSRILSRERRPVTPTSCGDDVAEVDLERGELTRG